MPLTIGLACEQDDQERRAALTPEAVERLCATDIRVTVESGIGAGAGWSDQLYIDAGAQIVSSSAAALDGADIVVGVRAPDVSLLSRGQCLIAMLNPLGDQALLEQLAGAGVSALAMELIPRISRAQSMDVLSSMATVAGYRAVLKAADASDKFFPMLMTAAGTVAPAKVFVIGAGVAGLQAIATARRLGAVVSAYDTRAAVREQVESLGARFVDFQVTSDAEAAGGYARELTTEEQERQRELMADHIASSDIVITTALVPGRAAPVIIPATTVERMRHGAVIVDLASENGGNCELTQHGTTVDHGGVHILGPANLPSGMPVHASQLYAKNLTNLLALMVTDGQLNVTSDDEIVAGTLTVHEGHIVHPLVRSHFGLPELVTASPEESA